MNTTLASTANNSFTNTGGVLNSDSFSLSVEGDFDYGSDFLGNGNIDANNQYFTIRNGDFSNNTSIALVGNLGITANNFINSGGSIAADAFALSVAGDFDYAGNIEAMSLNFQVGGDFSYNDAKNNFVLNENDSLVVLGSAFINIDGFINKGRIDVAGSFDVAAADNFYNTDNATISADNFNVSADSFYNYDNTTISADSFNVTTDYFYNTGSITADTFALSIAGDFDYASDFGNIDATNLNLQVGGDFFYDDASNDFVWNASDSFIVLGSADITANSFSNSGNITANTLNLSVAGDFDYGSDFLGNGNIDATTLNFQVGGDFSYSNANNNFVWNANNSLVVLGSASVIADDFSNKGRIDVAGNFNVAARDDFFNRGRIDVVETLRLGNFDVVAGDDFYNWYGATFNANNFNVLTGDRFYNLHSATTQCR